MKKFKFSILSLLTAALVLIISIILSSTNKTPDAGISYVVTAILIGLVLFGLGLSLDVFFTVTKSQKPYIAKRKRFWQIISVLIVLGIIYYVYVLGST